MGKSASRLSTVAILSLSMMLLTQGVFPAKALTATGVLEKGKDYVHFDLTLAADVTTTAFNITKKLFEDERETWASKWASWKDKWEGKHTEWRNHWSELMKKWVDWTKTNIQLRTEWEHRWQEEWGGSWKPEWAGKWDEWEDWMKDWKAKWKNIDFEEIEKIPEFIKPQFREKMIEKFEELWEKHMHASLLASCWSTPASQLGLKNALGQSLNRTLQWLYNATDVYVRNFNLTVEVTTKSSYTDGTYMTRGLYSLAQSFDLYGVVINNASGTFIRSQFRSLNVTEKVDGGKFGFPGWVFTPGKALFMDLSVFGVPFEQWNSTFNAGTNTTTFLLVKDINVTTPYGNVVIDPEMVLVVPGRATGAGDMIAVASILPSDLLPSDLVSIRLIAATTVVATMVFVGYYMAKRRATVTVPQSLPR